MRTVIRLEYQRSLSFVIIRDSLNDDFVAVDVSQLMKDGTWRKLEGGLPSGEGGQIYANHCFKPSPIAEGMFLKDLKEERTDPAKAHIVIEIIQR